MTNRIIAFAFLLGSVSAFGQGSQLPKYTVATLPAASSMQSYTVQVIDGANAIDCSGGGGTGTNAHNVLCVAAWNGSAWIWVPVATGGSPGTLTIQHNGTPVTTQDPLNFLDAAPSLPAGMTPVTFSTDSGGGLGGYVPSLAGGFEMQVNPPAAGQYVIARATVNSATGGSGGCTPYFIGSTDSTLYMYTGPTAALCSSGGTADWSAFSAPDLPVGAVITSIIPFGTGGGLLTNFTCSYNGSNANNVGGNHYQQWTGTGSGWGTDLSKVTCHYSMGSSSSGGRSFYYDQDDLGAFVYYTGSAPSANTSVLVVPPLKFNSSSLKLSLTNPSDFGVDTGAVNAYAVSMNDTAVGPNTGTTIKFVPTHTNTSATPTLNMNSFGANTIVGPQGQVLLPGDLSTTQLAVVTFGSNGNWWLSNPKVNGSGVFTVSTLPVACASGYKGFKLYVSDATVPTYLGTLTGGSSVFTPVICDGTNWVSY